MQDIALEFDLTAYVRTHVCLGGLGRKNVWTVDEPTPSSLDEKGSR
jgi:hypothetical protein